MGIVVSQYNPWRETLAAQLLGMVGGKYLENQRASEASEKYGALFREYPTQGVDQETSSLKLREQAELERQRSDMDAINLVAQMSRQGLSGAPSGSVEASMPSQSGVWSQGSSSGIPGVVQAPTTLNEMMGSDAAGIRPAGEALNVNSYDPSMSDRLPFSMSPEGYMAKGAVTPQVRTMEMMNRLGDPRFSPYAKELLAMIMTSNDIYSKRREDNYKDLDAFSAATARAAQRNYGMKTARTPSEGVATLGNFIGNPSTIFAQNEQNTSTSADNAAKNAAALEVADKNADTAVKVAGINASRPYGYGGNGYIPKDPNAYNVEATGRTLYSQALRDASLALKEAKESGLNKFKTPADETAFKKEYVGNAMASSGYKLGTNGTWVYVGSTPQPDGTGTGAAASSFAPTQQLWSDRLNNPNNTPEQNQIRDKFFSDLNAAPTIQDAIRIAGSFPINGQYLPYLEAEKLAKQYYKGAVNLGGGF